MRRSLRLCLALGLVLVVSLPAFAQDQGRGGGRNRGGGGGGRRGGGDPNQMFNSLSGGKDVIRRSEITDPRMQGMFDRWAQRLGITSGEITREQFTGGMQAFQQQRQQGNGAAPSERRDGGGGRNADRAAGMAENMFRQLDQNGDGVLNQDELPEALRAEREKWDTDQNGLIDLNEFKAYFQARVQQFLIDRNGPGGAGGQGNGEDGGTGSTTAPAEPEERRPVVYRTGKLPKELPAWFQQLDSDHDAQIGLYEWKAGGRPIAEFLRMDRNNDGFLTVEEVLRYQAQTTSADKAPAGDAVTARPASRGNGDRGAGPRGGADRVRNGRRTMRDRNG